MKIDIKGTIVQNDDKWIYDWCEMDSTCPKDVLSKLEEAKGGDVDIYINSGGGSVFAGSEIYSAIRSYEGKVKIHVVGIAASAASVIMCAAPCDISPTAMVMIHNAISYAEGNYISFRHEAEVLKSVSQSLCAAYVEKTGKSAEEIQKLMDSEKWFTAQEAVEMGLCDKIAESKMQLVAAYAPVIPNAVIARLKDSMEEEKQKWIAFGAESERLRKLEEI